MKQTFAIGIGGAAGQGVVTPVPNRRRNPNWPRPTPEAITPVGASTFEHLVAMLGLAPEQCEGSTVLREWARKNKNDKYVPSELLQAWRLTVDTGHEPTPGDRRNRARPHMTLD
jgi:hypothetical protein